MTRGLRDEILTAVQTLGQLETMQSYFEYFQATVARFPNRPALVSQELTVSWQQLAGKVYAASSYLAGMGIGRDDRVGLLLGNEIEFVQAFLALTSIGATVVPLNPQLTGASLVAVLEDSAMGTIITRSNGMNAELAQRDALRIIDVSTWADLPRAQPPTVAAEPTDTLTILYTSGTTGAPKGVQLSHACYIAGSRSLIEAVGVDEQERIMVVLPLFHANPQMYALTSAVITGACLILVPKFSGSRFWQDAKHYGATGFTYVGTVLTILQKGEPTRDHGVKWCSGGGAPESAWAALEDDFGVDVCELYGMTETGGIATINYRSDRVRGTCGVPRADMEVAILDEHDRLCAEGQMGEIAIRPKQPGVLFDCYINKPAVTLNSLRNLWFHTGDMAVLRDGRICFKGRKDHVIRRGGENISPGMIEEAMAALPAVREVAVVGVPHEVLGQEIKAVLVLYPDQPFEPERIIEYLARDLPPNCLPRYLQVVEALPKTPSQKVLVGELRDMTGQHHNLTNHIKSLTHV